MRNKSLDIIKEYDFDVEKRELYRDGIIICLKEIQNWAKLFGKAEDDLINNKINRWKKELNYILGEFEEQLLKP